MPYIHVNGVKLFYTDQGKGAETIVFAHGLLWSNKMFEDQIEFLQERYRVIAYDHRGQGQSEVKGPFDMETIAQDGAELIKILNLAPVHFLGLSMGGFVGMRIAARNSGLIKSLILMETSANAEPVENLQKYKTLNRVVRWVGILPFVAKQVMPIMFANSWLTDCNNKEKIKRWNKELRSNKKSITSSVEGVIQRKGVEDELARISCPTMIIVGDEDVATKPEKSKYIQKRIAGSILHVIIGAGHSSSIEKPSQVNILIGDWLSKHID